MPATSDCKRICNPPLLLVLPPEYKNAFEVRYLKNVASVRMQKYTLGYMAYNFLFPGKEIITDLYFRIKFLFHCILRVLTGERNPIETIPIPSSIPSKQGAILVQTVRNFHLFFTNVVPQAHNWPSL